VKAIVEGKRIQVMIDSGAAKNFMSKRILQKFKIPDHEKEKPYKLIIIDRSELPS